MRSGQGNTAVVRPLNSIVRHQMSTALAVIRVCAALLAAYLLDRHFSWHKKPTEELRGMALGNDWRHWSVGGEELLRRGAGLDGLAQHWASHLLAKSAIEREAARSALVRVFPWTKPLLSGFSPSMPPANTAEIVAMISAGEPKSGQS